MEEDEEWADTLVQVEEEEEWGGAAVRLPRPRPGGSRTAGRSDCSPNDGGSLPCTEQEEETDEEEEKKVAPRPNPYPRR